MSYDSIATRATMIFFIVKLNQFAPNPQPPPLSTPNPTPTPHETLENWTNKHLQTVSI